jgi:anti-anti-sigma factor
VLLVSSPQFNLTEHQFDDQTHEIRVDGELDLAVADQLDALLERATAERILIDLGGCQFIDSSGIAVILRADIAAAKEGKRILVHSPLEPVQRIFFITGLTETGLVFASREKALAEQARL